MWKRSWKTSLPRNLICFDYFPSRLGSASFGPLTPVLAHTSVLWQRPKDLETFSLHCQNVPGHCKVLQHQLNVAAWPSSSLSNAPFPLGCSLPFWQEASPGSSSQWQECLNPSVESLRDTCPAIHTQKSSGPVKEHIKFYKCQSPPYFSYFDIWTRSNWFQNQFLFVFFDIQSVNFCFLWRAFGMWVEIRCCLPQNELWAIYALSKSHHNWGFLATSKSSIWQPWMPKSQTIEAGCMLFCISISIQGKLVLHFIWNYTCPTPPKSTRLTKSIQFGNQQHFSFWSKRWNYNALRFLHFNFSILTVMKRKGIFELYLYFIFLWGKKKIYIHNIHCIHARVE